MKLNGNQVALGSEQTLLQFLTAQGYDCKTIAVERNGAIVSKPEYAHIRLKDEDTVEIVRFVGGG